MTDPTDLPDPKSLIPPPKFKQSGKRKPYEFTPEQWHKIEQWSIVPGRTVYEIARALNLPHARPDHVLNSCIKRKYRKSAQEYIAEQSLIGIGMVRDAMFRDALDGKHPITQIFLSKNFLGMKDERTINTTDQDNNKSIKALQLMESIIKRIDNQSQPSPSQIQTLERRNKKIEDANYTIVNNQPLNTIPLQPIDNTNNANNNQSNSNIENRIPVLENGIVREDTRPSPGTG